MPVMSQQHLSAAVYLPGFGEISVVATQYYSIHHSQSLSKSAALLIPDTFEQTMTCSA